MNRRKSTRSQPAHLKSMTFQIIASEGDYSYYKKIKNYLEFIFKVNFSNQIYTNIKLNHEDGIHQKYRVFIGRGNNSLLVKSIIKRRFWWEVVSNSDDG
jgi:hypothetical protein